jgi:hypothetical protein
MAVRNFWLDARIDGRSTTLSGGPVSKDGGFDLSIKIRSEGEVWEALVVRGYALPAGVLRLTVDASEGVAIVNTHSRGFSIEEQR